jgi:hypothetical protein
VARYVVSRVVVGMLEVVVVVVVKRHMKSANVGIRVMKRAAGRVRDGQPASGEEDAMIRGH